MRLKMRANAREGEDGQQPVVDDGDEGSNPNEFFSLGVYLYSYSRIWVRVSTRKLKNSSHSSSVNASWSAKFKNTTNRPHFTFEKTSEWSSFSFSRLEPGRSLNFRWSSSILLEDSFNVLACARYKENSTRGKERESLILTKAKTNTHWLKI